MSAGIIVFDAAAAAVAAAAVVVMYGASEPVQSGRPGAKGFIGQHTPDDAMVVGPVVSLEPVDGWYMD